MDSPAVLSVEPCVEALGLIRAFVRSTGAALGAEGEPLTDLVRAVDEAATNVVMHAQCEEKDALTVEMTREGASLLVRLSDPGRPYNPTTTPPPDLTLPPWERMGGLGVHLMRLLTDKITYRFTPEGGNELTLVKVLRHDAGDR